MPRKSRLEEPRFHTEWLQLDADPEPETMRRRDYLLRALAYSAVLVVFCGAFTVAVVTIARMFNL